MNLNERICHLVAGAAFLAVVISCGSGGGGGGGNDLEPADVSLRAEPRLIDSGDRIRVTANLNDVKETGVLLKFHYSNRLRYVLNTSVLTVEGEEVKVNAAANRAVGRELAGETYLVYDLPGSAFGESRDAELSLTLEGLAKLSDGEIEVDADFNEPGLTIDQKFTVLRPEFDPVASVRVTVEDSSGQIRPTATTIPSITPTPEATATATSTRTPRPSNTPTATP